MATTEDGVRSMVKVIEKEKASARVPQWPWVPLGLLLKHLPLSVARRFM